MAKIEIDPWEVLGVTKKAKRPEIRKAYHRLSKMHHPDMPNGDEALFKDIALAWEILGDSKNRKNFEKYGSLETPEDRIVRKAKARLADCALQLTHMIFSEEVSPGNFDFTKSLWNSYNATLKQVEERLEMIPEQIKVIQEVLARLSCKEEEDPIQGAFMKALEGLGREEKKLVEECQIMAALEKLIANYDYKKEVRTPSGLDSTTATNTYSY